MPSQQRPGGTTAVLPGSGPERPGAERPGAAEGLFDVVADRFPGLAGRLHGESWSLRPRTGRARAQGRRRPAPRARSWRSRGGIRAPRAGALVILGLVVASALAGSLASVGVLGGSQVARVTRRDAGSATGAAARSAPPSHAGAGGTRPPSEEGQPRSSLPPGALRPPSSASTLGSAPGASTPGSSVGGQGSGQGAAGAATGTGPSPLAVLQQLWTARDAALAAHDPTRLAAAETGPALWADTAGLLDGHPLPTPPASQLTLLGTPQDPSLVDGVIGAGVAKPGAQVTLVQAAPVGQGGAWRLTLLVQLTVPAVPSGQATTVPSGALAQLAGLWQAWGRSGQAPAPGSTPFALGGALVNEGQVLAGQVGLAELAGARVDLSLAAVPGAAEQMTLGQTVCGAIGETLVLDPTTGSLVQPASRDRFGSLVPPGTYQQVQEDAVLPVCVLGPPEA
ncbi:hypothetical protein [Aciditerrimonas ferrireducens]|uniref:hypothetical protein n=1 Tax=Aciditerrimonas ferrireducens TaxID=667306 RepID=UPI0020045509|nr:hypothetical protein [Aciditerrimonas ferrireducens]MCK4176217.1 hypothetical protein [Aciditerrimonas ferrireducens]